MTYVPGLVRSRVKTSRISSRYVGLTMDSPKIAPILAKTRPEGLVEKWLGAFREGRILRAEGEFETCGKGLWVQGHNSAAVAAAAVQDLLLDSTVESALYVMTEDYLTAERPDGDKDLAFRAFDDVVILSGYGTERRSESGWAEATIDGLIARRFDRGLPTIVTSMLRPPTTFGGNLASEIFFITSIMESTHEE